MTGTLPPRRVRTGAATTIALALSFVAYVAFAMPGPARAAEVDHPAAAPAGHDAAEGSAHEANPELIPKPGTTQIITSLTTLAVFGLLVVVMGRYAWGPIVSGLEAREAKIRKEIADAEAARSKADATLRDYNTQLATAEGQIRDMLAKATADAQAIADQIRARAEQDAVERRERAELDIQRATAEAVAQIHEQAAELVTGIAERVIPHALTYDDRQALVNRSLDELRTVANRG